MLFTGLNIGDKFIFLSHCDRDIINLYVKIDSYTFISLKDGFRDYINNYDNVYVKQILI